jgi:aryl sulfotransferase
MIAAGVRNMRREPERIVRDWHMDSRKWRQVELRPGDVIVGTNAKCGTTWMQRIVGMLLAGSTAPSPVMGEQPWVDAHFTPPEMLAAINARPGRRGFKTHSPLDAVPLDDDIFYIHVGRDPRDATMSYHHHCISHTQMALDMTDRAGAANPALGGPWPRPPADARDFFRRWLRDPAYRPFDDWTSREFFDLERSWWRERARANMLFVHYDDLAADLEGEIRRVAAFLGIAVPNSLLAEMVEAAGIDAMRRAGDALMPMAPFAWEGGAATFLRHASNGRWRDVLTQADLADYDRVASEGATPALRAWLEGGRSALA